MSHILYSICHRPSERCTILIEDMYVQNHFQKDISSYTWIMYEKPMILQVFNVNSFSGVLLSSCLTHWGRVTHICANKVTIVCSDNGLSPGRRQAIIWTNAGILLIGTLGTNFSDILIEIRPFSFKKMHLKMSSGKWWPFCLGLNVLKAWETVAYLCLNG